VSLETYAGRVKQVGLVVNPSKRRWREIVGLLEAACADRGWPAPQVLETTVPETGASQATDLAKGGSTLVLVAGGDGTVRSVAHGLAPFDAAMGVVPLGTANLFAHNLGIPTRDPAAAVRVALDGTPAPVDLGIARIGDDETEHPFLVLVGIGHDAATVAATRDDLKHRIGWPAYVLPAARHSLYRPVPVELTLDDAPPRTVRSWSILAANCGRVRAGVRIAAGAEVDDGLLDVMEVTVSRPDQWLPIAAKGVLGWRRDVPGLRTSPARSLEVVAPRPLHVQLDGDILGQVTRVRAEVLHRAIEVAL
jgi:diacylglycerol kinase (ATP)